MSIRCVSSLVLVLTLLCGCSSTAEVTGEIVPVSQETETDISKENEIASDIMNDLNCTSSMEQIRSRMMYGMLFDGDRSLIEGGVLYLHEDSTCADTVGVFTCEDIETCRQYLKTYLENRKLEAEYYSPDEAFKVSNAVLMDDGKSTLIMIIHKDIASARKAAQSEIENMQ